MDRFSGSNYVTIGGLRFFLDFNPSTNAPGSVPNALFMNGTQESILAPVVGTGQVPTDADNTQLFRAIRRLAGGNTTAVTASGTLTADNAGIVLINAAAGAIVLTLPLSASAGGVRIRFRFMRTDTSANAVTAIVQGGDTNILGGTTAFVVPAAGAIPGMLTLDGDGVSYWVNSTPSGRLLDIQIFTASGTYNPTPGAIGGLVEGVGGGAAGGGIAATGGGTASSAGGGGAGAWGFKWISSGLSSQTVTIGAGGTGVSAATGNNGGTTSFGAQLSLPGGFGGPAGGGFASGAVSSAAGAGASAPTGATVGSPGAPGLAGIVLSASSALSGAGASTRFGAGGSQVGANATINNNGNAAIGYGAGGGGATAVNTGVPVIGGNGAPGLLIVREYG